jgi:hypothetical protein
VSGLETEVDGGIWLVSVMDYDLGYIDLEEKTLQPLNNPWLLIKNGGRPSIPRW